MDVVDVIILYVNGDIKTMKYRKIRAYEYELLEEERFTLSFDTGIKVDTEWFSIHGREVYAKRGYCWDGATKAIDTYTIMYGSLIHDILYQAMKLGLLPMSFRELADKELKRICGIEIYVYEDGKLTHEKLRMLSFRQKYVYRAVRDFGAIAMKHGDATDKVIEIRLNEQTIGV